jgi:hypothetical protein
VLVVVVIVVVVVRVDVVVVVVVVVVLVGVELAVVLQHVQQEKDTSSSPIYEGSSRAAIVNDIVVSPVGGV